MGNPIRLLKRALLSVAVVVALGAVAPGVASAEPSRPVAAAAPSAGRAKIEVLSVFASNSGQVDPRLQGLKNQLPQMFTGFQLLSTHDDQVGAGQTATFPVEGDRRMRITLVGRTDDAHAQLRIEIYKDDLKKVDTTVTVPIGKAYTVGLPYPDGKLFEMVTVTF